MLPLCKSCKFGVRYASEHKVQCKRYPPVPLSCDRTFAYPHYGNDPSSWSAQRQPWMNEDDWCGEWKPKE